MNVQALLAASPEAEDALKVEWVDHIETFGLSLDADDDALALDWSLETDPEGLTDEDLPIASGSEAPQLLARDEGSAEVVLGLRDPSQVIDFALAAAKVVDPGGLRRVRERQGGDRASSSGSTSTRTCSRSSPGTWPRSSRSTATSACAAELEDAGRVRADAREGDGRPARVRRRRDRHEAQAGRQLLRRRRPRTATASPWASPTIRWSSRTPPSSPAEVATRGLVDAEGQEGAFVASADAEQLVNAALAKFRGGLAGPRRQPRHRPARRAERSRSASSTDGLTGHLELNID